MRASNKRLTILSELDQHALYDQPDFDDSQRAEFLIFTEAELLLILGRPGLSTQIHCAIQLGYFKAKQFFFRLLWEEMDEENILFVTQNYFPNQLINKNPITKHEYYCQRTVIVSLFNHLRSHQYLVLFLLILLLFQNDSYFFYSTANE